MTKKFYRKNIEQKFANNIKYMTTNQSCDMKERKMQKRQDKREK